MNQVKILLIASSFLFFNIGISNAFEEDLTFDKEYKTVDVTAKLKRQITNTHEKIEKALRVYAETHKGPDFDFLLFESEEYDSAKGHRLVIVDEAKLGTENGKLKSIEFEYIKTVQRNNLRSIRKIVNVDIKNFDMQMEFNFGPNAGVIPFSKVTKLKHQHRWLRLYQAYLDRLFNVIQSKNRRLVSQQSFKFSKAVSTHVAD